MYVKAIDKEYFKVYITLSMVSYSTLLVWGLIRNNVISLDETFSYIIVLTMLIRTNKVKNSNFLIQKI